MTKKEFEALRARIEARYRQDLDALDRVWAMFNGDSAPPPAAMAGRRSSGPESEEERKARKKAYMKAYWERRKAEKGKPAARRGRKSGREGRGIPAAEFQKFLVSGPTSGGANGGE